MTRLPTDPMVHLVIGSLRNLTGEFDIVHWTSQHLTFSELLSLPAEHKPEKQKHHNGSKGRDQRHADVPESSLPRSCAPKVAVAAGHLHGFRRVELCLHRRGAGVALEWIAFHCMQNDFF